LYGGNIEVFDLETVVNELHKLYSEKVGTEVVENFSGVSEVSEQEVLDWQNVVGRDIGQVHPRTTQGIKIKQENSRERIGELSTKIKDIVAGMVEADKMYVNNILPRGEQDLIAVLTKTQGWTLLQFIQEVKTQRGKYRLDLSPEEEENPQIQKVFEESFRDLADELGIVHREIFQLIRVAWSGQLVTPPMLETMLIRGEDEVIKRINQSIEFLVNTK
jgi:glutamyl/glutaminyl-tRNA synthetase